MPLISNVGRRSLRVRLTCAAVYVVLGLGAVTMIYPLLLMLSGSVKSSADFSEFTPLPRYLYNDTVLWRKYVEFKYGGLYGNLAGAPEAFHRDVGRWDRMEPPDHVDMTLVEAFRAFRDQSEIPYYWYGLGHCRWGNMIAKNTWRWQRFAEAHYDGDLAAYCGDADKSLTSWSQVTPPFSGCVFPVEWYSFPQSAYYALFYRFKSESPKQDWAFANLDGRFWIYLQTKWFSIKEYNKAHDTNHDTYSQVLLSATPPAGEQARRDWSHFVREQLNVAFLRLNQQGIAKLRDALRLRYAGRIDRLNRAWGTSHPGFDKITLPERFFETKQIRMDVVSFIKDPKACPLDALSVYGPRQAFEEFAAMRWGVSVEQVRPVPLPLEITDYADFLEHRSQWRWEFLKRNYVTVFDFILVHGNSIRNTVIYCALLIAAQIIINPLAAYALSRHKPPSTYKILLFCMATMAFPGEVTMIPSFLLLRRFPLGSLAVGTAASAAAIWLVHRLRPRWPEMLKGVLGVALGIAAGYWLAPLLAAAVLGSGETSVSLLNTFWALILPGAANGFSIFLLKGFFDSLPQELYEAADLDGAGEFTKFWTITMSLSKPILAVIALGAFNAAYSQFMIALVIIPKQSMWTLMIWLFQLQSWSHPSVTYASLVVAAIPTMLIFLFCQKLMMRGIIVPSEK